MFKWPSFICVCLCLWKFWFCSVKISFELAVMFCPIVTPDFGEIFLFFFFFGVYRDCARQTLALGDWGCAGYFLIYWDFVLPYFEFVIWMWSLPLVHQGLHPLSAQPGLHPRHLVYWISIPGRAVTEARIHDREPDPGLSSWWSDVRTFWLCHRFAVSRFVPYTWKSLEGTRQQIALSSECTLLPFPLSFPLGDCLDKCPPSVDQVCGL